MRLRRRVLRPEKDSRAERVVVCDDGVKEIAQVRDDRGLESGVQVIAPSEWHEAKGRRARWPTSADVALKGDGVLYRDGAVHGPVEQEHRHVRNLQQRVGGAKSIEVAAEQQARHTRQGEQRQGGRERERGSPERVETPLEHQGPWWRGRPGGKRPGGWTAELHS